MNRFVKGLGVTVDDDYSALSGSRLADQGLGSLKNLL
jgi:hypothetical protein